MDDFKKIAAQYRRINGKMRSIEDRFDSMEREVGLKRIIASKDKLIAVQDRLIQNLREQMSWFEKNKQNNPLIADRPAVYISYPPGGTPPRAILETLVDRYFDGLHSGPRGSN